MENDKYKIREVCGDYVLDVIKPGAMLSMFFNSRTNAELVKNVMEWEDAHPNQAIPYAPAVDAMPVVHAHWSHLGGDEWCCTACSNVITTEGSWERPMRKYCDECGAKMDGGEADADD